MNTLCSKSVQMNKHTSSTIKEMELNVINNYLDSTGQKRKE